MALKTLAAGKLPATTPGGEPAGEVEVRVVGLPEHKFTEAEMEKAFALVSPVEHWKAPISAEISEEMREVVTEAIAYYTASEAVFAEAGPGRLYVTAIGYWAGPAGG